MGPRLEDLSPRHRRRRFSWNDVAWSVYDVDAQNIPGSVGPYCLVFASASGWRRLWSFPANWFDLDDESLWRLGERSPRVQAHIEALSSSLPKAIAEAALSFHRAEEVYEKARAAFEKSRELRTECRARVEQCRAARLQLRRMVEAYTHELRDGGVGKDDAVFLVKRSLLAGTTRGGSVGRAPERTEQAAGRWCAVVYDAA
jgi:hypothetical protein